MAFFDPLLKLAFTIFIHKSKSKMKHLKLITVLLVSVSYSFAQLPERPFNFDGKTAIVITDPQNDFLSEKGVAWPAVGENVLAYKTRENLEKLFKVAADKNIMVFVSPHYYFPHDHVWNFEGVLERLMHDLGMFDRKGPLDLKGFDGSGADWLPVYKPYIAGKNVMVTSPHKVFGPESNDLALQLRKKGFDKVVLAGMSGNLCVESHMRDLLEEGFEVAVVYDATGSAIVPGLDGAKAAYINYKMIASKVYTTDEFIKTLK
jgi:nicotinamidase-related amidase